MKAHRGTAGHYEIHLDRKLRAGARGLRKHALNQALTRATATRVSYIDGGRGADDSARSYNRSYRDHGLRGLRVGYRRVAGGPNQTVLAPEADGGTAGQKLSRIPARATRCYDRR